MSNFWKDFSFPSSIDDILKRPSFTLEDIISEDEAVQDARNHKKIFVDYVNNPKIVEQLLDYVLNIPPEDATDNVKYKFPSISSEILMAEIPEVINILYNKNENYISRLYDYFIPENVNTFHATLAGNVITSLLSCNSEITLSYLKSNENILGRFVQHIRITSVTEFFFKLVSLEEDAVQFLIDQNLASILMHKFSLENNCIHSDIAHFIIDLLQTAGSDSLLFESFIQKENIDILFKYLLEENNTTALIQGLRVIISYIYMVSDLSISTEDTAPQVVLLVIEKLSDLRDILTNPSDVEIKFSSGNMKPLGIHRCKIVELVEALVQLNYEEVINGLINQEYLHHLIEIFFLYEQNSILHKAVYHILCRILDRPLVPLIHVLLEKEALHKKIISYEKECRENEAKGKPRTSCIAYSLLIAQHLAQVYNSNDTVKTLLESEEWNLFNGTVLAKKIEEESKPLGNSGPPISNNSSLDYGVDDDDINEPNINYNNSDSSSDSYDSDDGLGSEDEDDDLEYDDDSDIPSENDFRDYDVSKAEVLLTKFEIENVV